MLHSLDKQEAIKQIIIAAYQPTNALLSLIREKDFIEGFDLGLIL